MNRPSHSGTAALTLLVALLTSAFAGELVAQAPPSSAKATPDAAKLAERNRLSRRCEELLAAGEFTTAIQTAEEMLQIEREILPADAPDIHGSLIFLAETAQGAKDWKRADSYRTQLVEWLTKHRGADHWLTADARVALAELRRNTALSDAARAELQRTVGLSNEMAQLYGEKNYAAALVKAEAARDVYRKILGKQSLDYATSLNNLALVYTASGDAERAEAVHREQLEILRQIVGENHPIYADALHAFAHFYNRRRDYAQAATLFRRAADVRRQTLGEHHLACASSLSELAAVYGRSQDYEKVEPLLRQAMEIRRAALGEKSPEYARSVLGLAFHYNLLGDYARAEPLYLQGTAILKEALGATHPDYATGLNNLAVNYQDLGEYGKAEAIHREVLAIRKVVLGEKHLLYALSLANLAAVQRELGDYERAKQLYLQALEIEKQTAGENSPEYPQTLHSLALVYDHLGDRKQAEALYRQSLTIGKAVYGEKHPQYAVTLNNLAEHYVGDRDFARAEPLLQEAAALTKANFGDRHPSYATQISNLAVLYHQQGDLARAEPLFRQALEIRREAFGEHHPDFAAALHNLACLYAESKRPAEAVALFCQSLDVTRQAVESAALLQSERLQLSMGRELRYRLDAYVSLGLRGLPDVAPLYARVLEWKGATLRRQRGMRLAADDPKVAELFAKLQQAARELTAIARDAPSQPEQQAERRRRVEVATQAKETLEAELSRRSADYRAAASTTTVDDLLAALPPDAALVDFLEFTRSIPPTERGQAGTFERQLAAFVVRRAGRDAERVQLIALGPAKPVAQAIDLWRESYGATPDAAAAGNLLRKTLWEPLLPQLAETKTILVSSDGVLGRLPLVALPGKSPGTYLLEDHRLAMIPVPQLLPALVGKGDRREASKELLLLGDVDYDAAGPAAGAAPPKKKAPRRPGESRSADFFVQFSPLEYTKAEITGLRDLFGSLFDVAADDPLALARGTATEAEFRKLAPQYRHLHLATHGFFAAPEYAAADRAPADSAETGNRAGDFFAAASRDAQVVGFNPGLLSGLAMAGANLQPQPGGDDGVLTSLEIAFLPLQQVDLVVLSACDTGLGAVAGGEGLLGVQRAFQVAGVGTTVAGLWKVDDLQTMALMKRFYHNLWEEELPRLDALREAQLWMLREGPRRDVRLRPPGSVAAKPEETQRASPRYWAPFILSGDWR